MGYSPDAEIVYGFPVDEPSDAYWQAADKNDRFSVAIEGDTRGGEVWCYFGIRLADTWGAEQIKPNEWHETVLRSELYQFCREQGLEIKEPVGYWLIASYG